MSRFIPLIGALAAVAIVWCIKGTPSEGIMGYAFGVFVCTIFTWRK